MSSVAFLLISMFSELALANDAQRRPWGSQAFEILNGNSYRVDLYKIDANHYSFSEKDVERICPIRGEEIENYHLELIGKNLLVTDVPKLLSSGKYDKPAEIFENLHYNREIQESGIHFSEFRSQHVTADDGVILSIPEPGYSIYFSFCEKRDLLNVMSSYLPGEMLVLVKPSELEEFKNIANRRRFSWKFETDTNLIYGHEVSIKNLIHITNIEESTEIGIASELLSAGVIYDYRRLHRSGKMPKGEDYGWYGTISGNEYYVNSTSCSEVSKIKFLPSLPESGNSSGEHDCFIWQTGPDIYQLAFYENGKTHYITLQSSYTMHDDIALKRLYGTSEDKILQKVELFLGIASDKDKILDTEPGAYSPGTIIVLVRPNRFRDAEKWFHENNMSANWQDKGNTNEYLVETIEGGEYEAIDLVKQQDWAIDAQRMGVEKGGPPTYIFFPENELYASTKDQQRLFLKIKNYITKIFPNLKISDDDFSVEGHGMTFKLRIKAPMKAFENADFGSYWIKAKVVFYANKTANGDRIIRDNMVVEIPDSFLAKWDRSDTVPPDGHFDHLSPEGSNKYKNFSAPDWLQNNLVQHFLKDWNGTLD